MFSHLAYLLWLLFGNWRVAEVWDSSNLYPWEEQYPFGSNLCPLREYSLRSWGGFVSNGVVLLDAPCPCPAVVNCFPDLFIHAFLACAMASFAVSSATWLESSEIVFVSSANNVLSAYVAVVRFASARVYSCLISVNSYAFACASYMYAIYPLVLEFLEDLLISLKARSKWVLKFPHVLLLRVLRNQLRKLSW